MDILERIVVDKRKEVAFKKGILAYSQLENIPLFGRSTLSLASALRKSRAGIIAEHKRRSPSKSVINQNGSIWEIVQGYEKAGAAGISILTDTKYFGGCLDDLLLARAAVEKPLLRKEFIIDEYQIVEAKAYGADVILLIAALLSRAEIKSYSELAKSLGLEVLLEVHNDKELQKSLMPSLDMLGVNNRDLKTFKVSLETSKHLSAKIPDTFIKVSESGIGSSSAIEELISYGYQGFLMGEHFMKAKDPGNSASNFIKNLKS